MCILFPGRLHTLNIESKHKVVNHPVHIINKDGDLSPSALIPFCGFGSNILGTKIDDFDVPVCDGFNAYILNDQLCYKIDPDDLKNNVSEKDLNQGFSFFVDTNTERYYSMMTNDSDFMIYLGTLGKIHTIHYVFMVPFNFCSSNKFVWGGNLCDVDCQGNSSYRGLPWT